MHAEIGAAGEFRKRGADLARFSRLVIALVAVTRPRAREQDRGAHPFAQGEIIGAKDEAEHSGYTDTIRGWT